MKKMVHKAKSSEYADVFGIIKSKPLCHCISNPAKLFIQFEHSIKVFHKLEKNEVLQKIVGWADCDLLHLATTGPKHYFMDCTFKCVPKPFKQLMVIMIYEEGTELYIPVFYILMEGKSEKMYMEVLRQCCESCDNKLKPLSISCDFERAILNSINCQFPNVPIVGCEFHFKQAIRKKLINLNVRTDVVSNLVDSNGLLQILTQIPISEIENRGIPYVRSNFDELEYKPNFDKFWKYFVDTWMVTYDPKYWNIHTLLLKNNSDEVLNRTNNPLERFNRTLNDKFSTAHPTLPSFVHTIRTLSNEYAKKHTNIKNGHEDRPVHEPVTIHPIPNSYYEYAPISDISISRHAKLSSYSWLLNSTHYDDEDPGDPIFYRVTRVYYWNDGDEIVGDREEVTITGQAYGYKLKTDTLYIEDIKRLSITKKAKGKQAHV
jgi:hypothetical protein